MPGIEAVKDEFAEDWPDEPAVAQPPVVEPPKQYKPGELEAERKRLFEEGSLFKPTYRTEIVGIDAVLDEIDDLIHYLHNSGAYLLYDARPEPGVIFEGEPGTGKTSVARYIATASAAFFVNVRDWPHKGSLLTDSDIKALFEAARLRYARTRRPVVLFYDEFEGIACERAGATPEQAAAVSQLTAELDGIHGKNEGILLIGCTNYIYGIDHALRRSGRMGLSIEFHAPDRKGKRIILDHYLATMKVDGEPDTEMLSYFFDPDATAADIEESCMEAWRYAVRRSLRETDKGIADFLSTGETDREMGKPSLSEKDLIEVFLKRLVGPPTTFIELDDDARFRIAVHECGHALVALVYGIPLRLITVQPGKKALGRCMTAELEDHIATVKEMVDHLLIGVGSICAEEVCEIPAMLGSVSDVTQTNELAAKLVDRLELGERTGLFNVNAIAGTRSSMHKTTVPSVSDRMIDGADQDINDILKSVKGRALAVMERIGKNAVEEIAREVNERVTLTGVQFRVLVERVLGRDIETYAIYPK